MGEEMVAELVIRYYYHTPSKMAEILSVNQTVLLGCEIPETLLLC